MKTIQVIWTVVLAVFSSLCFYYYFTLFYWHLGFFGLISFVISSLFFMELLEDRKNKSNDTF